MLRDFLNRLLFDRYVEAYNTYNLRDKGLRNDYLYHYTFLIHQSDLERLPANFFWEQPR